MISEKHPKQKTLGFLGTGLITFMQNQLWRGAMKAAKENHVRLVFYPTINLSSRPPFTPQSKVLFELVDDRFVDGLLIWYGGIAEWVSVTGNEHFFEYYKSLPLVTIGGNLRDCPDLVVDNCQGVRASIEHLIRVHHCKHIATIRGPVGHPDADARYRTYVETLQAHNLPANPEYVAEALFERQMGAEMAEAAIAHWIQDLKLEIDAVVAGSDFIALPAIRAIQSHGLRVPEDIAVVGFDDIDDAQACIPSVTTVRQSFYDLGQRAVEMLLALMSGQALPQHSVMPTQFIMRESCGCAPKSSLANMHLDSDAECLNFLDGLANINEQDLSISLAEFEHMAMLFQQDLDSQESKDFLTTLKAYLTEAVKSDFNVAAWQDTISILRRYILSNSNGEIDLFGEALFDQARVYISEVAQRVHIKQQLRARRQIEDLRQTSEALITSFEKHLLVEALYEQIPKLGFPSFYLALYEDPAQPASWARLILAYEKGQQLELPSDGLRFPSGQLIPKSLSQQAVSFVVEPLYFRDEQLGILILEVGPLEGEIYENLRAQISSALQGSHLLQKVQQYAVRLEQRVAERTAELTQTVKRLQVEISERQRAEDALRLANFAIEHASDAIYWIDPGAGFIDVNEAACHMLGYTREELIGMTLGDIDPTFKFERWPGMWESVKTNNLSRLESIHRTKDGQQIPVEIMANYVVLDEIELNCAIVRDISHRREAEQAIRQLNDELESHVLERTQQLEAANSEMEAFAYSVSHDLRAPLRAIHGYSQALLDDHQAELVPDAQYYLNRIQHNAQRMGDLIDDLLSLSRIGRQALRVEAVDMNQLVGEVLLDLSIDNNELSQVEIVVDTLPSCKADRSLLKQVWVNLISNAIKYSSKCEQPRVEIHHGVHEHKIMFFVKDNGIGFDMQYANKLFGVFQRLHSMKEYEGTGIGLATVRRIIGRHGGEVWAEAEVNMGATFYFTVGDME